jgi:PmbA protein
MQNARELVELSEADETAGPADPELLGKAPFEDLELYDPALGELDAGTAFELAKEGEAAALAFDPRITLSEGATLTRVMGASAMVLSTGFSGGYLGSYGSLVVVPVAEDEGGKKRRGSYWTARRHRADLDDPTSVGEEAARRTLRQLGPRKVASQTAPVVFDPDVGRAILGSFGGCILGGSIWRKSSYLSERLGTRVASPLVTIIDDPLLPRAPGSRPFDGEGLRSRKNVVVSEGNLETFLLDSYAARKLGLKSTASGARGGASVSSSTSNFILQPGTLSRDELLADTKTGLYVTELMGFGFNAVTGDFSRGATGFWIEDGKLAYAVSEITISSNLDAMMQGIDALGNDLDLRTSTAAPTFRIAEMTISGT